MMKLYLVFFTLINFVLNAQGIEKTKSELANINTVQQANEYLSSRGSIRGQILELNSRTDSTDLYKDLLNSSAGNLIHHEAEDKKKYFFFKTLEAAQSRSFRVQYIFLDNKKLTLKTIDSLREIILKRVHDGEPFKTPAKEYSMDSNAQKGGDLGWFDEGMMMKEFEQKIKSKETGEIYSIDIPSEKWYYIVKNTHTPRINKKVVVLYIEIKSGM